MSTVKERTQNEIIDFIRAYSQDGKLQKSMLEIANHVGYSNATVHRALKALEKKGLIQISEAQRPTEPNTIVYKGDKDEVDELINKGVRLSNKFQELTNELTDYLYETNRVIRRLDKQMDALSTYQDRIVNVVDIPNTDLQMVTLRKEAEEQIQGS